MWNWLTVQSLLKCLRKWSLDKESALFLMWICRILPNTRVDGDFQDSKLLSPIDPRLTLHIAFDAKCKVKAFCRGSFHLLICAGGAGLTGIPTATLAY